jgi:hypothetical protein
MPSPQQPAGPTLPPPPTVKLPPRPAPRRVVIGYAGQSTPPPWTPRAAWLLRMGLAVAGVLGIVGIAYALPTDASVELLAGGIVAAVACVAVVILVMTAEG